MNLHFDDDEDKEEKGEERFTEPDPALSILYTFHLYQLSEVGNVIHSVLLRRDQRRA